MPLQSTLPASEINDHQIRTRIRTSHDAEVLADLYKAEASAEEVVTSTQAAAKDAEDVATEAGIIYRELIQKARHEEQLWRDKVQYWSTWGTILLVGSNLLLWCVMEPWRRRRIVSEIRRDIKELSEEERRGRVGLMKDMVKLWPARREEEHERPNMIVTSTIAAGAAESPLSDDTVSPSLDMTKDNHPPNLLNVVRSVLQDPLNGQSTVSALRPVDFTKILVGAAAAGCAVTASIVVTVLKSV